MSLLKVDQLVKTYFSPRLLSETLKIQALRGVNLELGECETLAVVGESGCGKSTLAKVLLKLEDSTSGSVSYLGKNLKKISQKELPQTVQMVFQDPNSSLNPRKKIKDIIAEPLMIRGGLSRSDIQHRVKTKATEVGLREELLERYPHMLSGGQKQRVGIARALVTDPKIIICDEPVSALDVSVQAQVLNLLLDLQQKHRVSYLFISHDLGVVKFLAHRVAVMYLGLFVEVGSSKDIFSQPQHPYTKLLLSSSPAVGKQFIETQTTADQGELPSPLNPPKGCAFHSRCPFADEKCRSERPELRDFKKVRVACHHVEKI